MTEDRIAILIEKLSEKFDANREHQDQQIEKLRIEQKEALQRLEDANKDRFNRVDSDLKEVKARVEKSDGDLASIRRELSGRSEGIVERFASIEARIVGAEQTNRQIADAQAVQRASLEKIAEKIEVISKETAQERGASGRDAKILWAVIVAMVAGVVSLFFNVTRQPFPPPKKNNSALPRIQPQPKKGENAKMQRTSKPSIVFDLDQTMITILNNGSHHPPTGESAPLHFGSWVVKRPYLRRCLAYLHHYFDLYLLSAGSQAWVDQNVQGFGLGALFKAALSVDSIDKLRLRGPWVLVDDLPFEHPNTQRKLRILGDVSPYRLYLVPAFQGDPNDRLFLELGDHFIRQSPKNAA